MRVRPLRALAGSVGLWSALWLAVGAASVRAQGAPSPASATQATYEQARLDALLRQRSLEVDAAPEGKLIAYVRYERREVFEGADGLLVPLVLPSFAPTWPNTFHWLTEERTVARELLLHEGERFSRTRAEESMRNLRELGIFAHVRIVAVRTTDPARVGVVVYTRDLWSLRLETSFSGAGTTFSLAGALVERNFLGRNKELSARVFLDPLTYSVGETYLDPRMFGSNFRLYESLDVILNRASGEAEGSTGTLRWGVPFHSLEQSRSFDLSAYYADYVHRDAPAGRVAGFDTTAGESHGDACELGAAGCVARVWDDQSVRIEAALHERVGERYKQTFTGGVGFADRQVADNAETALTPTLRPAFERDVLPLVRREAYPWVRYRLSLPTFATFSNLASFGQSESVQVGPRLDARFALPLAALGSSRDGLVSRGIVAFVWAGQDALVDFAARAGARLDGRSVIDEEAVARLRAASPSYRWLQGRIAARAEWTARRRDTQNTFVDLGGDTGLRGYESGTFYGFGASAFVGNVEYRSRPWELRSIHLGGVAFYDVGSVYRELSRARAHHALGLGLRVLFPQFNRQVFRVDAGVPLDAGGFTVSFSYASSQTVALTPEEDVLAQSALTPE